MSVPPRRSGPRSWVEQGAAALLWGIFFVVVPIDILMIGAILWLPLLLGYEWFRARRYGFFPGFLLDLGLVLMVGVVADAAPLKSEDQHTVVVPDTTVALSDLGRLAPFRWESSAPDAVRLPSRTPTLREVTRAVETQTPYRCRIMRCGNGMTLLWGGYIMGIGLERK